jgi:hypothetical protein
MDVAKPGWFTIDGQLDRERGIKTECAQLGLKLGPRSRSEPGFPFDPLQFGCKPLRDAPATVERFGQSGFQPVHLIAVYKFALRVGGAKNT